MQKDLFEHLNEVSDRIIDFHCGAKPFESTFLGDWRPQFQRSNKSQAFLSHGILLIPLMPSFIRRCFSFYIHVVATFGAALRRVQIIACNTNSGYGFASHSNLQADCHITKIILNGSRELEHKRNIKSFTSSKIVVFVFNPGQISSDSINFLKRQQNSQEFL